MNVKKVEWRFAVLWSVFIVLLTLLPYEIAKAKTPAGMCFTDFISNSYDQESYMAWMKQASQGSVLFEDKYTTENQSGMFFHPLFLLCGKTAGFFGLDMLTAYHIMRVVFGAGMLLLIYLFGTFFIKEIRIRRYFLIFISLAAGWGFLAPNPVIWFNKYNIMSLDMWVSEASTFLIVLTKPLFAFSLGVLLAIFMLMLKAFHSLDKKLAYAAGVLGLFLALTHPYDVFTAYIILFFYLVFKRSEKEEYYLFALFFFFSLIGIGYQFVLFTYDPVLKEWAKTFTPTPNPLSFIVGYGFSAIFTLLYIIKKNWKRNNLDIFLVVWLFAVLMASYFPVNFQRRLLLGFQVPLVILAVKYIFEFLLPALRKIKLTKFLGPGFLLIAIVMISIPTNIRYVYDCFSDIKSNIYNYNLYMEDIEALNWLDKNTNKKDAVLASKVISLYIPARSGNKVYAGHYDQTVNYAEKTRNIQLFYQQKLPAAFRQDFLKINRIKYIYFGPFESMLGNPGLDKLNFLQKVYSSSSAKLSIYKVKE